VQYNQPFDQPSNSNAPYIDGNPAAGIQGSIVPAASIEFDQREIVEVITRANIRGYSDFSNTLCAVPNNADLLQLRKAIEGFIRGWEYIIDTEVTFTVHGSGADFPDLIKAFDYLGKYRITPRGHVILQLAGAAPGSQTAIQYGYTQPVIIAHPNNDRISIFGAQMLAGVPRTDAGYAWNGSSPAQRAQDISTNLVMLRTKFATELRFLGNFSAVAPFHPVGGITIIGKCLMHLDSLLFTSDGASSASGVLFNAYGYLNDQPRTMQAGSPFAYDGLACVGFTGGSAFNFDVGSCISAWGQTPDYNYQTTWIGIGCGNGIACTNGGFVTAFGNAILLSNNSSGMYLWPRAGTQWDGGLFLNANGDHGLHCYLSSTGFMAAPVLNGAGWGAGGWSHYYRNAGWGIVCRQSNITIAADCGTGPTANGAGQCHASDNSSISCSGVNFSAVCSPPFGTVGNGNSMIN